MPKDYYKTLGVNKNASKDDIKKAFRKMAHQYHPDKTGGDAAKFKEASEAYSVLSDDGKRAHYDQFGSAPNGGTGGFNGAYGGSGGQGGGFGGFDFSNFGGFSGFQGGQNTDGFQFDLGDIFGDLFGGGRATGGNNGGRSNGRGKRGSDIAVDIELTFKESVYGADKKINLTKNSACTRCKGEGKEPGTEFKTCDNCKGKGQIKDVRKSIFGSIAVNRECEICQGTGKIPNVKCKTCHGAGIENKHEEFTVHIPAGMESGEAVRVQGAGESLAGGNAGDLYIRVHVEQFKNNHNFKFKKDGNNIVGDINIKVSEAILGADKKIETVDGEITVAVPSGINHGEILRIKNRGFVIGNNATKRGDLLLKVSIDIPKKISKTARKLLEDLKGEGV